MQTKLAPHEWLAVLILITMIILIGGINLFHHVEIPQEKIIKAIPTVTVTVEGVVENPGEFTLPKGAKIEDVLKLAIPKEDALLTELRLQRVLKQGQVVKVPGSHITIYLEGAVKNPGPISVFRGSHQQDLIALGVLSEDADIGKLKKKKLLKDGEKILILHKN